MRPASDAPRRLRAFAPGRVNLIGEHTDYNGGRALPFAVEQGVVVTVVDRGEDDLVVTAADHGQRWRFAIRDAGRERFGDWRDFVRGAIGELVAAGIALHGGEVTIEARLSQGAGLASSAAFAVALCLALRAASGAASADRTALARLCSRIENDWVGARTGLLDQLASLLAIEGHALRIDFRTLDVRPVPVRLGGWRLVTVDSGERHWLAGSGYNARRSECERARDLLGLEALSLARHADTARLPEPLDRRVRHVIEENARVDAAVAALEADDMAALGALLDASHASLRDLYDSSTGAVERTVERVRASGAAGARMIGGGFGGQVLALLPPGREPPPGALMVVPSAGARLLPPR